MAGCDRLEGCLRHSFIILGELLEACNRASTLFKYSDGFTVEGTTLTKETVLASTEVEPATIEVRETEVIAVTEAAASKVIGEAEGQSV